MHDQAQFEAARAHFSVGLAALTEGRAGDAEAALRRSLALLPGRPSTLINLAVALLRQARAAEALPVLDEVLAAQPDDVDALGHRAVALNELHRPAEALPLFERVVALAPQRVQAWYHLGQTWQMLGRPGAAVPAYDRCLALAPQHARAHSQRGSALKDLDRDDEAAAAWTRALELGDDVELNRFFLASTARGSAPPVAPRDWVQGLFDDYAPDFDRHLVDVLGYRAPEVLTRLLLALAPPRLARALDLGCGTGLCGARIRPLVDELTGVDLAPAMVRAAQARGCYDRVLQAELLEHLAAEPQAAYDLVLAGDVFIYIGELQPVLAAVRRVLRPQGLFAFSTEPAEPDVPWRLQGSLRYAHGEAALRALAERQGLLLRRVEHGVLRQDQQRDVPGLYWVLQAP